MNYEEEDKNLNNLIKLVNRCCYILRCDNYYVHKNKRTGKITVDVRGGVDEDIIKCEKYIYQQFKIIIFIPYI